jgi:hypothetical protein
MQHSCAVTPIDPHNPVGRMMGVSRQRCCCCRYQASQGPADSGAGGRI